MLDPSSTSYPLIVTHPSFSYTFTTDGGAAYAVNIKSSREQLFLKELGLDDVEVWEFQFFLIDGSLPLRDPKIEITIINLISELVAAKENILWYICESTDGKQAIRAKLFDKWYQKYASAKSEKLDGRVRESMDSSNDLYVSIILNKNNPHLKLIESIFYSAVNKIDFSKNPGASL